MAVPVAVVGATGYTGVELIRLLSGHPEVELAALTARADAGRAVREIFPQLGFEVGARRLEAYDPDRLAERAEVVFLALPHGAAAGHAAELRARGRIVIDLSADFRLRHLETYTQWYGPHPHPELLPQAIYGLPERYRSAIRRADLIAVPGCYPTATLLAVLPLVERGLVEGPIVADCKSGVTGAGRSPKQHTLLAEAGESFSPYAVAAHRHEPEIAQELARAAEEGGASSAPVVFTPHLVPMARGIVATCYVTPAPGAPRETPALLDLYLERYQEEPFVEVLPAGRLPATGHVRGSNRAQVTVRAHPCGSLIALSAIDNLVKGAAGQAVQCMNLRLGFDEGAGLPQVGLFP
ncbi:MAG: N-acetyl-gamma-glutamyl-phosphate reductase [Deltaproteobacteria bacterium]|nr:MAG: N-acetyl-gamma-glutamyl-phosphate reductase [Deltaproteobacteria bacterium]